MNCFGDIAIGTAARNLVLLTALACTVLPAGATEAEWEAKLRKQLQAEHECELNYLTGAGTIEILGKKTFVARAHCKDKRSFDVQRQDGKVRFEFKSCEQVSC